MFASRNEEVLFMETAMHLARQRRHCLIECIPVPPDVAKQAPLYFKKVKGFAKDKILHQILCSDCYFLTGN